MESKKAVDYSKGKGTTLCRNCRFFRVRTHRCLKVAGIVNPQYWCKRFKRRIP